MTVVTQRTPTEREWGDLTFAWRVAKHVGSNAIVIAKDLATVGIGAGQMSRVDAVRIAHRQGAAAGRGRVAGVGRVLPVRRRAAAGARGRRALVHPAGRREARRRRDLGRRPARGLDGLHRAPALPPLIRADRERRRRRPLARDPQRGLPEHRDVARGAGRAGPAWARGAREAARRRRRLRDRDAARHRDPHAVADGGRARSMPAARGIGSALWTAGAAHLTALGVTTTRSLSIDGVAAGAQVPRTARLPSWPAARPSLELDLRDVPPAPPMPVGIHLVRVPVRQRAVPRRLRARGGDGARHPRRGGRA